MRRRERPGKKPLYASAGVHVLGVVLVFITQMPTTNPADFLTYEITLVSPPPSQESPDPAPVIQEEVAVETPEPVPEEEPPPVVEEEQPRQEERPTPTPTPPPPDPDPVEEAGDPEPSEEISGEDLNIRMEGLKRDFPEYYDNIIRQIQRCFEYKGSGRLETAVIFYISRDGSVDGGNIDFFSRSGNFNFDFAAMGAVECAGRRFGPLPEDLGFDRLPILFTFTPRGEHPSMEG